MFRSSLKIIQCLMAAMLSFAIADTVIDHQRLTAKGTAPVGVNSPIGNHLSFDTRIANRTFPSIFQAWNPATNLDESDETTMPRHDLYWGRSGLSWNHTYPGLATDLTKDSLTNALQRRNRLLSLNPNMILLEELHYRDAGSDFLPADSRWWLRDSSGDKVVGWSDGSRVHYLLDYHNPEFRQQVATQAKAAVQSGVVDGIMLDWWGIPEEDDPDRIKLLQAVRQAIGEQALILVNGGDDQMPKSAPYINGSFMEGFYGGWWSDWKRAEANLLWAEQNLRSPRINALEGWYKDTTLKRQELNAMRAITTLVLTHSNGYVLFAEPNSLPVPDHLHDWYPFWDKSLRKPGGSRYVRDGASLRDFQNGTAVYNPPYNKTITITFPEERQSAATGAHGKTFTLKALDGDLFLMVSEKARTQKMTKLFQTGGDSTGWAGRERSGNTRERRQQ